MVTVYVPRMLDHAMSEGAAMPGTGRRSEL